MIEWFLSLLILKLIHGGAFVIIWVELFCVLSISARSPPRCFLQHAILANKTV
ncbi:MAG: hypothetical protein RBR35_20230 [Salinivirgaceae bacterium]|nr:hypothetical protein [Salinivirgaceae bacterium]